MNTTGEKNLASDSSLIESLMNKSAFDHAVNSIELIETHISWVILAGDYVYKIKKPVKLDFLDFHDLVNRKFYCEEEVRLNRSWAPEIYLDVVPITFEDSQAKFSGTGCVASIRKGCWTANSNGVRWRSMTCVNWVLTSRNATWRRR
jgi:hypothetical protein